MLLIVALSFQLLTNPFCSSDESDQLSGAAQLGNVFDFDPLVDALDEEEDLSAIRNTLKHAMRADGSFFSSSLVLHD